MLRKFKFTVLYKVLIIRQRKTNIQRERCYPKRVIYVKSMYIYDNISPNTPYEKYFKQKLKKKTPIFMPNNFFPTIIYGM